MTFATFSIVACDPDDGMFGVAVASKFLAVGAYVPYARADGGAIATQAAANLSYGPRGLDALTRGQSASEVVRELTDSDAQRDERQVGVVDLRGNSATFTGAKCMAWAGGLAGRHFAVQGNILAGEGVVAAMAMAFETARGDLSSRLLAALTAGDDAGGDRRGKQSATILVVKPGAGYGGFNDRWLDLRVDDHTSPVAELARLCALHSLFFGKTDARDKLKLDKALIVELQRAAQRSGHYTGAINGVLTAKCRGLLENFIGAENLEERVDLRARTIDPPALDYILARWR